MPSLFLHGGGDQENILDLEDMTLWLTFHVTHFVYLFYWYCICIIGLSTEGGSLNAGSTF